MSMLMRILGVLVCIVIMIATFFTVTWIAYDFGAAAKDSLPGALICGICAGFLAAAAFFTGGLDD